MDYVEVLEDMIRIDTTVPPGRNYGKMIEYLEPLFRGLGFTTERVDVPPEHAEGRDGRVNLVCHRRRRGVPRLIFYGHIDVVPAEDEDAFEPRVEDGRIFGRGSADMKGGIVALLLALDALKNRSLRYDVSVIITTDEEYSQASQLRYLAQYIQPVAGSLLFSLDSSFGFVAVAGLGALHLDIRVEGKSVHSGLSHLGENAVENAVRLVAPLLELKKKVEERRSSVPTHPATGLSYMQSRLNVNVMRGGTKVNIVPDECLVSVDRRLIPEENIEDAQKELLDVMSSVPGVRWEIERTVTMPTLPAREDPVIDALADIVAEVTGETGKYGEMGSGDMAEIVAEWGGKEFGLGVIRPECNIHGRGEFVYRKDIEDLAEIIRRFLV